MRTLPTPSRCVPALAAALLLLAAPARAQAPEETPHEVKVERAKPMREQHPTLRFLRENRDFIRARFDRLREKPIERRAEAAAIDPRFLAYREMLLALAAGRDSLARLEDARARRELFASVTQLGELEAELDALEKELAGQRGRLATLEKDFTGDQRTELIVVVSGLPADIELSSLSLELEDGGTLALALGLAQQAALRGGGMIELLHAFVEPRHQTLRVGIAGASWPSGDSGWLELEPARDRLNLLRLDLSGLGTSTGAPGIRARAWVHATSTLSIDG